MQHPATVVVFGNTPVHMHGDILRIGSDVLVAGGAESHTGCTAAGELDIGWQLRGTGAVRLDRTVCNHLCRYT